MTAAAGTTQKIWRVIDLIRWGEEYFSKNDFENPRREIELLLTDILDCERIDLYVRFEETVLKSQLQTLRDWIIRRINREPLQYITGKAGFYSLDIKVTPDVMIPRPETERLVEIALQIAEDNSIKSILDVGTGSGCIALALAKNLPDCKIIGIDKSVEAVKLARENAADLKIDNVEFTEIDFSKNSINDQYDMIVSNPPYIPQAEMDSLMKDVREFEPHLALTDGEDGLILYRQMAEKVPEIVKSKGWLLLEVGLGEHPQKAMELFSNNNFQNVELIKDYNGDDRVLKVQKI